MKELGQLFANFVQILVMTLLCAVIYLELFIDKNHKIFLKNLLLRSGNKHLVKLSVIYDFILGLFSLIFGLLFGLIAGIISQSNEALFSIDLMVFYFGDVEFISILMNLIPSFLTYVVLSLMMVYKEFKSVLNSA